MLRHSRGLLLLVGALALLTLLHWASALGGGAHSNAQMGSGLLQHLDAMRQTNRRLTAELDSSRAAQAAAQSAAQTAERVLREENAQLKADRDAALTKAAQNALRARAQLKADRDAALTKAAQNALRARAAVEASAASRPAAVQAAAPAVAAASSLQASDFSGRFLVASVEEAPEGGHSPEYLGVLLRR
jgi:membrane protein involved in colicin uptake